MVCNEMDGTVWDEREKATRSRILHLHLDVYI